MAYFAMDVKMLQKGPQLPMAKPRTAAPSIRRLPNRRWSRLCATASLATLLFAQASNSPAFESVSFEIFRGDLIDAPYAPSGPGTSNPRNVKWVWPKTAMVPFALNTNLARLVDPAHRLSGSFYQLQATLPAGATTDDYRAMLRTLLSDRLHLRYHKDVRDMPVYELRVAAKGARFKTSVLQPVDKPPDELPLRLGADGYPVYRSDRNIAPRSFGGRSLLQRVRASMAELASDAEIETNSIVLDRTGLAGKYDFALKWTARDTVPTPIPGKKVDIVYPPFADALKQQLGLELRPARAKVEVFVIDRMD